MKQKKSASRSKNQPGRQNQNKQNPQNRNTRPNQFSSQREPNGRDQARMMHGRRATDGPHSGHELSQAEIANEFGRGGVRASEVRTSGMRMGKMRRGMQMKNTGAGRGSASSSEELLQYAAMILNQIEERVSRLSQELESFQASGGRQGRDQGREQWSPLRQEWRGSRESGSWEEEDEKQHWSGRGSGRFERNSRYRDEE